MSAIDHVAQVIAERDPGCVVTRFVLIAEVIGPDGERGVWTETHEEAARWETYGLLAHAMQAERAAQTAAAVWDADDD